MARMIPTLGLVPLCLTVKSSLRPARATISGRTSRFGDRRSTSELTASCPEDFIAPGSSLPVRRNQDYRRFLRVHLRLSHILVPAAQTRNISGGGPFPCPSGSEFYEKCSGSSCP